MKYCNHTVQISDGIKYLGVELDDKLSFLRHRTTLEAKLSRNVGILFKLKKILPTSALVTLYFALIHPFLSYGVILWDACNKSYSTKLRSLQNNALRAIGNAKWYTPVGPLYHKSNTLKLSDLYRLELGKFMHMFFSKSIPCYFNDYFIEFKNTNKHNTRSCTSRNLKLPLYSTNQTQKSIKFQGAKLWNALSFSLKQQSRSKFVQEFKNDEIANYYLS